MNIQFSKYYFSLFILLFITEVVIALYIHDNFIRPYFGDVLVVILIYCFVLSFLKVSKIQTAICVLLFVFGIELSQYFNLVGYLGLQKFKLANIVMGNSFAVEDLVCYVFGIGFVVLVEKISSIKKSLPR
ncbi:DUF2809 domain-containing protein [Flavobacterium sp. SUN052]|uniref:ribosomal maturation YjgA family protein n=1 Tax=Flavobacterium sp. SUN052 TaxID=3002441 RepID=UPI00237E7A00|nr:DUF2809 domain-containing protein [Flavobacterium sp. SUN052]MEC4005846.1 DUF2809 domain-containing protein [Flavobacterium sp. SUN052]